MQSDSEQFRGMPGWHASASGEIHSRGLADLTVDCDSLLCRLSKTIAVSHVFTVLDIVERTPFQRPVAGGA